MKNAERIQELKEVAEMASLNNRHDVVETCYLELREMGFDSFQDAISGNENCCKLYRMSNSYTQNTPVDQVISDRLNQLIAYYGKANVFGPRIKMKRSLKVHLDNLKYTYGKEKLKYVGRWFTMSRAGTV